MAISVAERESLFQQGLEAYGQGLHYEAHDFWETLWEGEDDDRHRLFLQALIQVASAMHKVLNDVGPNGALRLLDRALEKTAGLPESYGGIALGRMRTEVAACRVEVARRLADGTPTSLDRRMIPTIAPAGDSLEWRQRPDAKAPDHRNWGAGFDAYARGSFFEAHELWEELWRDEEDPGRKRFLQGLILVAASMHKLRSMKSAAGAARLMARAQEKLQGAPEGTAGVAVEELCAGVARARLAIDVLIADGRTDLEPENVPKMSLLRPSS